MRTFRPLQPLARGRGSARTLVFSALAGGLAAGAVAGCGSTSTTAAAAGKGAAGPRSRPTELYRSRLTGVAESHGGAPAGQGFAIIAFHGSKLLCWRFAHLHGFTSATGAAIAPGAAKHSGPVMVRLSSGPRLHHRGCEAVPAATSTAIARDPGAFYVNVFATAHPGGAVRGQL